jgi:hypothetical protein
MEATAGAPESARAARRGAEAEAMGSRPLYHRSVRAPALLPPEVPRVVERRSAHRSFVLFSAVLLALPTALWACAPIEPPSRTPADQIGEPAPTAVTSAVPLWLSNDPTRKAPPTTEAAVKSPPVSVIENEDGASP